MKNKTHTNQASTNNAKARSLITKKVVTSIAMLGVAFYGNTAVAVDASNQNPAQLEQKSEVTPKKDSTKKQAKPRYETRDGCLTDCDTDNRVWDLGRGWKVSSFGGLSYEHPNDSRYWFKVSGVLRFDETLFMGSYRDKAPVIKQVPDEAPGRWSFANGAKIRTADLYIDGGVGENWEYTWTNGFTGNRVKFGDCWIAYSGFLENNQVFVGRVPGNWFGLDNANSTSWMPFLERGLATNAFYPGDGLGLMTDFWWDCAGLTFTFAQPEPFDSNIQNNPPNAFESGEPTLAGVSLPSRAPRPVPGELPEVRDRWRVTARGTFAPVHEMGNVWHFGLSGAWKEVVSEVNGVAVQQVSFATTPSANARNTAALVNTGYIRANNVRWFNAEIARQCGPLILEAEYTEVYVHRVASNFGTLRFHGWNVQGRYLLTGEAHEYDVRDGSFGSVKPNCPWGALEVAARFDFVNLNNKNIFGGAEHNVTVGLNWYVNGNVRLSANYIRANIIPSSRFALLPGASPDASYRRHLDIIGMRCQIRFK